MNSVSFCFPPPLHWITTCKVGPQLWGRLIWTRVRPYFTTSNEFKLLLRFYMYDVLIWLDWVLSDLPTYCFLLPQSVNRNTIFGQHIKYVDFPLHVSSNTALFQIVPAAPMWQQLWDMWDRSNGYKWGRPRGSHTLCHSNTTRRAEIPTDLQHAPSIFSHVATRGLNGQFRRRLLNISSS